MVSLLLQVLMVPFVTPVYDTVGWVTEEHNAVKTCSIILFGGLCQTCNNSIQEMAKQLSIC